MEVLGTAYPVPPHKAFMAKVMMVAQYGSIGLLLGGEQLFAALGMPVPELYQQYRDKRTGIVLGIWLLGNALQNQLVSTGAFEVYYDGERVFSKLESGRVPSTDELIDLLEAAMGLPPSFEQRSRI
ncbi:probable thioredoxin reductase-like selenoprotein T [Coccomyxa sp. Obi]|nr:probable thioredoxin reductase-like selenoprotein T [Coccomyxa sp. Obi]